MSGKRTPEETAPFQGLATFPGQGLFRLGHTLPLSLDQSLSLSPWREGGARAPIARTIKSLEKALHGFSLHPFIYTKSSVLFALSSPSIFSSSPTDIAKRPHSRAHSGRTRSSNSPFHNGHSALIVRWWIGNQKKGTPARSPCRCKDTT